MHTTWKIKSKLAAAYSDMEISQKELYYVCSYLIPSKQQFPLFLTLALSYCVQKDD